jgi:hypothetical protein
MAPNQRTKAMTTHMDLQAELRRLQEENARLKANKATSNGIKVSAKGAVSVYGLGRFPVTLYRSQWEKLLAMKDSIEDFIEANEERLASKDEE